MAEDLNTLIENVSNMVLATLYGLQVCMCIVLLLQIKRRRREQRNIRRAFFLLCLVGGVLRCVWFAIPDSVFAQGYRPENRRPTALTSTPFLLNALQFALYSLPNCIYFFMYCLLICFWGGLLHVLFSQRPTSSSGGGGGGATHAASSTDSSRLIAYRPAARFFRWSVIGVSLVQLGLFVSIFIVDFFSVVIANCVFVSALALFSIVAYALHAVAVYRKLRPVFMPVLEARREKEEGASGAVWPHNHTAMDLAYEQQAALLAASSSSAAFASSFGRPSSLSGVGGVRSVGVRSGGNAGNSLLDSDETAWSIDAAPRSKKGSLMERIGDREDRDWRDFAYSTLGGMPAPPNPYAGHGSRNDSQPTSPHSHNSTSRYSSHHSGTTMPPSLALLHAQHQTGPHTPGSVSAGIGVIGGGGLLLMNGHGNAREMSRSLTQTTQSGRGSVLAPVSTSADELSYAPGPEEGEDSEGEEGDSGSEQDCSSRDSGRGRGSRSGSGSDDASDTERRLALSPHSLDVSASSSDRSGVASPGQGLLPAGSEDPYASLGPHVLPPMPAHAHMQSMPGAITPSPRYPPPPMLAAVAAPVPRSKLLPHSPARSSASNSGGSSPSPGSGSSGLGTSIDHVIREEDFYRTSVPRSPSASASASLWRKQSPSAATSLSRAASPDYVAVTLEGLAARPVLAPAPPSARGLAPAGSAPAMYASSTHQSYAHKLAAGHTTSYASFTSASSVTVATAGSFSSSSDECSAEEALALYAYRQTRQILLLTVCVGLCSGARIASSLIELHYTWLQVQQENDVDPDAPPTSAFPDSWWMLIDCYYLLFELLSSTVATWLLTHDSGGPTKGASRRTATAPSDESRREGGMFSPVAASGPPFTPQPPATGTATDAHGRALSGAASVAGSAGWGDKASAVVAASYLSAAVSGSRSSYGGMSAPLVTATGSSLPAKHAGHTATRSSGHHGHRQQHHSPAVLATSVPGGAAGSLGHHSPGAHFASLHSRLLGETNDGGGGGGSNGSSLGSSVAKGSPRSLLVHHSSVSQGGVPVQAPHDQASIAHRENLRHIFGHRKSKR